MALASVPKHKGVGILAVVTGIRATPGALARVPEELRHYLCDRMLPSGWYPESDYVRLIELLAEEIDTKRVGGDVWAYFGRVAAQRDIAGEQARIPLRSRVESAGVYRNFADGSASDIAGLCSRGAKLWSLYHDTGRVSFGRDRTRPHTVVMQLHDFAHLTPGLHAVQTNYFVEYARLLGIKVRGDVTQSVCNGAALSEWHYHVEADAEQAGSLAAMSVLDATQPRARLLG